MTQSCVKRVWDSAETREMRTFSEDRYSSKQYFEPLKEKTLKKERYTWVGERLSDQKVFIFVCKH